jgi:hypothetical protein
MSGIKNYPRGFGLKVIWDRDNLRLTIVATQLVLEIISLSSDIKLPRKDNAKAVSYVPRRSKLAHC